MTSKARARCTANFVPPRRRQSEASGAATSLVHFVKTNILTGFSKRRQLIVEKSLLVKAEYPCHARVGSPEKRVKDGRSLFSKFHPHSPSLSSPLPLLCTHFYVEQKIALKKYSRQSSVRIRPSSSTQPPARVSF